MQSQGIGKILLNYAKDKRNKLYLNVYQKNARAISFYKREGFEIQHSGLDEVRNSFLYRHLRVWYSVQVPSSALERKQSRSKDLLIKVKPKNEKVQKILDVKKWVKVLPYFFQRCMIDDKKMYKR